MKHSLIVLTLLLRSVSPASAWQHSDADERTKQVQQWIDVSKERLALTPQQIEQVRPVLEEEIGKLKAVREKYSGSGQSRRTKLRLARELRDIQRAADDRLGRILSKAQMDELRTMREERKARTRQP